MASRVPPTGYLARNPGMCPDWDLNRWPFDSQASAQSTEPRQPEFIVIFKKMSLERSGKDKNNVGMGSSESSREGAEIKLKQTVGI